MAFLGIGKKKELEGPPAGGLPGGPAPPMPPPVPPPAALPVDQVLQLRAQGFDDNQIIQSLQRDGFDSGAIADAMTQVNMPGGAAGPLPPPEGMPPPGAAPVPPGPLPPMPAPAPAPEAAAVSMEHISEDAVREKIEGMAEVIIEEKWETLVKDLNKFVEWKDKTDATLTRMEQQFKEIKSDFDNLHRAIIGKIGEYDQNILNVGTEIKAMEKVFQKILPTFTENVSELSRLTKGMKGTKKTPSKPPIKGK